MRLLSWRHGWCVAPGGSAFRFGTRRVIPSGCARQELHVLTNRRTNDRAWLARLWSLAVKHPESRWHPIFWLSLATLTSLLVRLPLIRLPMIADEGGYAYVARRWLDGRGTLYDDIWVSRPQGIFLAYGAIFHTIGTSAEALRIGAWIVTVATMALVWLFAERWSNRSTAALAVMLFAVLSGSPGIEGFTANAEVFMALPSAAAVLTLLKSWDHDWSRWRLLLTGGLIGAATLLKPTAIVMLFVGAAFAGLVGDGSPFAIIRRWWWIGFGFGLAIAPAFIDGYLTGWHNFIYASITYRMTHQSSMQQGFIHHLASIKDMSGRAWPIMALGLIPPVLICLKQGFAITVEAWMERLSESGRLGVARRSERPLLPAGGETDVLLRLWLVACLAGIAMGGDWWNHYLIQILAPLAIWISAYLLDARRWLSARGKLILTVAMLLLLFAPYRFALETNVAQASADIFYHEGYADQDEIAVYLDAHAPVNATILAAFNEPQLYYLADRAASYRYLYNQELEAIPESEADLIALLNSSQRPLYIIGTKQPAPFADKGQAFWEAVSQHYTLEAIVRGQPIFRAAPPPPLHAFTP
jgi:hypothetical protein